MITCTYCHGKGHATVFAGIKYPHQPLIDKQECRHCRGRGNCPLYTYETGGKFKCLRCPTVWSFRTTVKETWQKILSFFSK